jgi:hypothetical protein
LAGLPKIRQRRHSDQHNTYSPYDHEFRTTLDSRKDAPYIQLISTSIGELLTLLLRGPASLRERLHTAGTRRAVDGGPIRLDGGRRRGSLRCGRHLVNGTERVQGGPRCECSDVLECEISGWTDGHSSCCNVGLAVSAIRNRTAGALSYSRRYG